MTAEPISSYTAYFAKKIKEAIVVDGCCSVGGNLIQFALLQNVTKCIGVELNEVRIKYAENNCQVYGIDKKKLIFLHQSIADVQILKELDLKPESSELKKLVFFFDPPWGGLSY